MARCCGGSPRTNIEGGQNILVTGIGTLDDPFVIATDLSMLALDNDVFDVTIGGSGTIASPWTIGVAFAATADLNDLPDVDAPTPTNGQVLAWNAGAGLWQPVAPTTAAAGSVIHNTSLTGDGSVGSPLAVAVDAARYIQSTASGVGINDAGINQLVRTFADDAARTAATIAPVLNTLSVVNTRPGRVDHWNGSAWVQIDDALEFDGAAHELVQLSGAYANSPLTMVVRKFSGTTDANGLLTVLDSATLSGRAGVLSATVSPTGAVAYNVSLTPGVNSLAVTARRVDDGVLLANQTITGQVTAYVY
jgi:hypothetical protein